MTRTVKSWESLVEAGKHDPAWPAYIFSQTPGPYFHPEMKQYCGKIIEVSPIREGLKTVDNWTFTEWMLEL